MSNRSPDKNISISFSVALPQDLSLHFNLRIREILEVTKVTEVIAL